MPEVETIKERTTPALIALLPRQIMLAKHNMKNNVSSETPEDDSLDKTQVLESDKKRKKKNNKKGRDSSRRLLLLHSIAQYLNHNGFTKTLKAFRLEALGESDGWKGHLDLEDIYHKYLESCEHHEENLNYSKEQDLQKVVTEKDEGESKCDPSVFHINKKKRKKSDGGDFDNEDVQPGGVVATNICANNSDDKLTNDKFPLKYKGKRKKKHISDSLCKNTEEVRSVASKEHANYILSDQKLDESEKMAKDENISGRKLISESLSQNEDHGSQGERKAYSTGILTEDASMKSKDKKKKKNKKFLESLTDELQQSRSENVQDVIESKLEFSGSENNHSTQVGNSTLDNSSAEISLGEKTAKFKDKKRKKKGTISEGLCDGESEQEKSKNKEKLQVSNENTVEVERKDSRKRKRIVSEENGHRHGDETASKEAKDHKLASQDEDKESEKLLEAMTSLGNDSHTGKKRKTENVLADSNKFQGISFVKKLGGCANGNLVKNEIEGSGAQKSVNKQYNGSAEPKTVNAFQRVKVDEVGFIDERLQDNSYWAKDGADTGYGARAQEVLGQVRGRDFRHEKTKKKRGSYRGGQIDLQSHSVKFNYSDDE